MASYFIIELIGLLIINIIVKSGDYEDPGATASDNDVDISENIIITGIDTVDTTEIGQYQIKFSVSDTFTSEESYDLKLFITHNIY